MWARWANLVLGIWLMLAPFILGYVESVGRSNHMAVGLGLAVVALGATSVARLRYVNTLLGIWLLLSPMLLGYGGEFAPTTNAIIVGAAALVFSLVPTRPLEYRTRRPA